MSDVETFAGHMGCSLDDLEGFRRSSGGIGLEEFLANKRPISDIVHFGERTPLPDSKRQRLEVALPRKDCGLLPDEAAILRNVPMLAVEAPRRRPRAKRRLRFLAPRPAPRATAGPAAEEMAPPIAWTTDLLDIETPVANYTIDRGFSMYTPSERAAEVADSSDSDDELVPRPRITDREKKTPAYVQWARNSCEMEGYLGVDTARYASTPVFGEHFHEFCPPDLSGVFDGKLPPTGAKVMLPLALCSDPAPFEPYTPLGIGSVRKKWHEEERLKREEAERRAELRADNRFSAELLDGAYPKGQKRRSAAFRDMLAYSVPAAKPAEFEKVRDAADGFVALVQHDEISPALGRAGTLSEMHLFKGRQPSQAFSAVPWSHTHCDGSPLAVPGKCGHPIGVMIRDLGRCAVAPAKHDEGDDGELFVVAVDRKTGKVRRAEAVNRRYATGQWFPRWPKTDKETELCLRREYNNRIVRALWSGGKYRSLSRARLEALMPPLLSPKQGGAVLSKLTREGKYMFSNGPPALLPVSDLVSAALEAHALYMRWKQSPATSIFDDIRAVDPFVAGPVLRDYLNDKCILVGGGPGAACVASVNLAWRFPKKSGVVQAVNDRVAPRIDHPNGHYPPIKSKIGRVGTTKDRRRSTDEQLNEQASDILVAATRRNQRSETLENIRRIYNARKAYANRKKSTRTVKLSKAELQKSVSQKWELLKLLQQHEKEADPTDHMPQIELRIYSFREHAEQRVNMKNCWLYDFSLTGGPLRPGCPDILRDRYKFPKPKQIALKTLEAFRPPVLASAKWTRYRKGDLPPIIFDSTRHSIVDGRVVDTPSAPNSATVWAISCVGAYAELVQMTRHAKNAPAQEQKEYLAQRDTELRRFQLKYHPPCISDELMKKLSSNVVNGIFGVF